MENTDTSETQWTRENTLGLIRGIRNDLAKDFLDERILIEYLSHKYNKKELSNARIAFVKKDLKDLLIAPVDVDHYSPLIHEVEENHATGISYKNEPLFYKEIDKILSKHIF
ncbi:MAG TPA: hypothetical protein VFW11_14955 [Cyclobacteriaceae bacterium]|nr:hypothetical protein [Cyclobacteriaceae bacterium]